MHKFDLFNELSEHVQLRIHSCREESHGPGWTESKAHLDYDLWFVESGQVRIRVESGEHHAGPGDVIFFYPYVPYSADTTMEGCRFIYVHFDFGIGDHFRILDDFNLPGVVPGDLIREDARLFCDAYGHYRQNRSMSAVRLKGCLHIFLAGLMSAYESGRYSGNFQMPSARKDRGKKISALQPVLSYIQDHLHRPVSVRELADKAGMSEKYFITCFKKAVGLTPGKYIHQLRMNRARDYLYQKRYSVRQIADFLGYPDPYTFSRAFKKYYHVPPSRFV